MAPPYRRFWGISDETWRWLHVEAREQCPFLRDYLPGLPDDPEFEKEWVGSSGAETLAHGFQIYKLFKGLYEKYAGPLTPERRVLDFGCGFGRVTRFFLKDVVPENLVGIDSSERALQACADQWTRFQLCDHLPPTDLEDESFDLIYAFAVFSHLSEEAHLRWLAEFKRLLKPGGVLLLTTFPREFCECLPRENPALAGLFSPLDDALAAYDRGEFVYRVREPSVPHFGTAFIPERYVLSRWMTHFDVQDYFGLLERGQNVIVCTR